MAGVNNSVVTRSLRSGKLKGAAVNDRVDLEHPAVVEYLEKRKAAAEKPKPKPAAHLRGTALIAERKKLEPPRDIPDDDSGLDCVREDIAALADKSLRYLIRRFGTDRAFCDWLKAVKDIETIDTTRLKNAQLEGKLVARDTIQKSVLQPIDAMLNRMLGDGSKTISRRVVTMVKTGKSTTEIEKYIQSTMSSFIKPMKARTARGLKNA